jgi:hypothetical protein
MFVNSVNYYKNQITDKDLRRAIQAFAGQELMHGKIHEEFNAFLAQRVPDAQKYCDELEAACIRRETRANKKSPYINLAVTVALEHLTATMATGLLERESMLESIDPEIRNILIWHSIEEIEHKSVAFDVYNAVKGPYMLRVIAMLSATAVLTYQTSRYMIKLLRKDGQLFNLPMAFSFFQTSFGLKGYFTSMIGKYFSYFKPSFHPAQEDNTELLAKWSKILEESTDVRVTGKVIYKSA